MFGKKNVIKKHQSIDLKMCVFNYFCFILLVCGEKHLGVEQFVQSTCTCIYTVTEVK